MTAGFNRYEILTRRYRQELRECFDWDRIKRAAEQNPDQPEGSAEEFGCHYLGSVFGIMPSGKFYMPWTTNQTRADVIKDQCYFDALQAMAAEHGCWVENGEGNPCDVFVWCHLPDAITRHPETHGRRHARRRP